MPSPTQNSAGAIVRKVALQSHLSISGTEENGANTATEFYLIEWTGGFATTEDCRNCSDGTTTLPSRSTPHPTNSALNARRVEIRPAENNSRQIFQARIEYSDDVTSSVNPLSAPPEIIWDVGDSGKSPYFLDNDPAGPKMVLNAAGDRFAEFLERYTGSVSATFAVNIAPSAWNPAQAIDYCAGGTNQSSPATNSDSFTFDGQTITQGQALAKSCKCSAVQIQNGVQYRVKTWTLLFCSSWIDVVDNRGFNQKITLNGHTVLQPIIKGGTPDKVDFPWPLTTSGLASPNVNDTPLGLTFYPYRQKAFSGLGFS